QSCQAASNRPMAIPGPLGPPGCRSSTTSATMAPVAMSSMAARSGSSRAGSSSLMGTDPVDDMAQGRLFRDGTPYKIPEDLRILQFENACECVAILRGCLRVVTLEIARQQDVELPHAAPAATQQSGLDT